MKSDIFIDSIDSVRPGDALYSVSGKTTDGRNVVRILFYSRFLPEGKQHKCKLLKGTLSACWALLSVWKLSALKWSPIIECI